MSLTELRRILRRPSVHANAFGRLMLAYLLAYAMIDAFYSFHWVYVFPTFGEIIGEKEPWLFLLIKAVVVGTIFLAAGDAIGKSTDDRRFVHPLALLILLPLLFSKFTASQTLPYLPFAMLGCFAARSPAARKVYSAFGVVAWLALFVLSALSIEVTNGFTVLHAVLFIAPIRLLLPWGRLGSVLWQKISQHPRLKVFKEYWLQGWKVLAIDIYITLAIRQAIVFLLLGLGSVFGYEILASKYWIGLAFVLLSPILCYYVFEEFYCENKAGNGGERGSIWNRFGMRWRDGLRVWLMFFCLGLVFLVLFSALALLWMSSTGGKPESSVYQPICAMVAIVLGPPLKYSMLHLFYRVEK